MPLLGSHYRTLCAHIARDQLVVGIQFTQGMCQDAETLTARGLASSTVYDAVQQRYDWPLFGAQELGESIGDLEKRCQFITRAVADELSTREVRTQGKTQDVTVV